MKKSGGMVLSKYMPLGSILAMHSLIVSQDANLLFLKISRSFYWREAFNKEVLIRQVKYVPKEK